MTHQRRTTSLGVADQVAELASAAVTEAAHRRKASAERAARTATVDAWFSRQRAVLVAFAVSLPVLAVLVVTNITGRSLGDLLLPAPTPHAAEQLTHEAMDAVVKRVESFRSDYSELPRNLVEVGVPPHSEWTYAPRAGGQYQITVKMLGQSLTFDAQQQSASVR